jgi:hypothetical protein
METLLLQAKGGVLAVKEKIREEACKHFFP